MSPKAPRRPSVPTFDTRAIGARIGIDWPSALFDIDDLRKGILVELEHADVTGGDLDATAKIAWAHLRECADYYTRLEPVEKACKKAAAKARAPVSASPRMPSPGWGESYGGVSYITRPEGTQVWLFRKGQKCRFYDAAGRQVGPEQSNVAPAVAMAMHEGWRDVSEGRAPRIVPVPQPQQNPSEIFQFGDYIEGQIEGMIGNEWRKGVYMWTRAFESAVVMMDEKLEKPIAVMTPRHVPGAAPAGLVKAATRYADKERSKNQKRRARLAGTDWEGLKARVLGLAKRLAEQTPEPKKTGKDWDQLRRGLSKLYTALERNQPARDWNQTIDAWEFSVNEFLGTPQQNPYQPGTLAHVFEEEERNPAKESGGFDYRGFHVEPTEGTWLRPPTEFERSHARLSGGHKKIRGYLIYIPDSEGATKFVPTQKSAREYIDSYLGDEKKEERNPTDNGAWSAPYEISKLAPTASLKEEGRFFQTLKRSEIVDLLDDHGIALLEPSDGDAYQGPIELKAKSSYDDMLGARTRVWVRVPAGTGLLVRVADEGAGNPEYEATFGAAKVSVREHRENPAGGSPASAWKKAATKSRDVHGKFIVHLKSVPNPDIEETSEWSGGFWQGGRMGEDRWDRVSSLDMASRYVQEYIRRYGLGMGNWAGGEVLDIVTKKEVARVSYNGRVWPPGPWKSGQQPLREPFDMSKIVQSALKRNPTEGDPRTVAALFVAKNGHYFNVPGVDPWDETRNALLYAGPYPVVAHPPCDKWGKYAIGDQIGQDGGKFAAALAAVRSYGGVIEHPESSKAWKAFGLTPPKRGAGWTPAGDGVGFTCYIEQGHYGHRARKGTWLYAAHVVLPDLQWGPSEAKITPRPGRDYERERRTGAVQRMCHRERLATPESFRDLLISIARTASPPVAESQNPARPRGMTYVNINSLYRAYKDQGEPMRRFESTSIPHLRRAIEFGFIEAVPGDKGAWRLTELGREQLAEHERGLPPHLNAGLFGPANENPARKGKGNAREIEYHLEEIDAWRRGDRETPGQPSMGLNYGGSMLDAIKRHEEALIALGHKPVIDYVKAHGFADGQQGAYKESRNPSAPDVGLVWASPGGQRRIESRGTHPTIGDVFLVSLNGSPLRTLVPVDEIESEIRRDTANYESRQRATSAQAQVKENISTHDSWFGFTDQISDPKRRAKAIDALNKQVGIRGVFAERGKLIADLVASGFHVRPHTRFKRILEGPEGSFFSEADLTSTGMNLAEFLAARGQEQTNPAPGTCPCELPACQHCLGAGCSKCRKVGPSPKGGEGKNPTAQANPRPIPLDRNKLVAVAKDLGRQANDRLRTEGKPFDGWTASWILGEAHVDIDDVAGHAHKINVYLHTRPSRGWLDGVTGSFSKTLGRVMVELPVDPDRFDILKLGTGYRRWGEDTLLSTLLHEFTHARDVYSTREGTVQSGMRVAGDTTGYLNRPVEVKARMQELADLAVRSIPEIKRTYAKPNRPPVPAVQWVLEQMELWQKLDPHLTRANRNKIFLGVERALRDAGLDTEGKGELANPTADKLPFHGGTCYACDAKAVGLRDRRHEGGSLEPACKRHADPKIKVCDACMYCNGPVRKGSVDVDGNFAHKACHAEACK